MVDEEAIEELIIDLFEGELNEAGFQQLQTLLKQDPRAKQIYREYALVHNALELQAQAVDPLAQKVVPIELIIQRQRKKQVKWAAVATAAILLVAMMGLRFMQFEPNAVSASFEVSPGARYALSHVEGESEGENLLREGSRLELSQGVVEVVLTNGVRGVVSAPADLTLHEAGELYLARGEAWFDVPRSGHGFTVRTDELRVVDLGTRFGVAVHEDGYDEVHVYEGKVLVETSYASKDSWELGELASCRATVTGKLESIAHGEGKFLTQLPRSLPYYHWGFDQKDNVLDVGGVLQELEPIQMEWWSELQTIDGVFGQAFRSDNEHLYRGDWQGVVDEESVSIACWIKAPKGQNYVRQVVGWGRQYGFNDSETNAFYLYVEAEGGVVVPGISLGGYWVSAMTDLSDGEWHHVVFACNGSDEAIKAPAITCYIDGKVCEVKREWTERVARNADGYVEKRTAGDWRNGNPVGIFGGRWGIYNGWTDGQIGLDELYLFKGQIGAQEVERLYRDNAVEAP
ncbi:LamG-like jellyroll fold domain-containing protein [Rubritalea tangerina]|uniref:LamG-like jellyroll fold domain-containing protein n=2 Tax=Rubritalea tangerina TaxID=430798 RepID=A0ABW4ZA96_9BACT